MIYFLGIFIHISLWILAGYIALFLFSFFTTRWFIQWAHTNQMLDTPNKRSAHKFPTPRGGGISFVLGFLLLLVWGLSIGKLTLVQVTVYGVAGLMIAAIGFLDDRHSISASSRFVVHCLAAGFVLWILPLPIVIPLYGEFATHGVVLFILLGLYLVWCINLYNFMDGLDGLAAAEAMSVCVCMAFLYWLNNSLNLAFVPLGMLFLVGGFLCFNWPKARIFMGDIGSGFLGMVLAILSLDSARHDSTWLWCWLIMLGVFVVDSTFTLIRRAVQGASVLQPHNTHTYQSIAKRYNSHRLVVWSVMVINKFWLLPLALLVAGGYISGLVGLSIAYIPLVFIALSFLG